MKKSIALAVFGILALSGAAAAEVVTYSATDLPKRIPVSGTAGDMDPSVIVVPSDGPCSGRAKIFDVNVGVALVHTFMGDLAVRVSHDGGSGEIGISLFSGIGGSLDDMNVVVDDQADAPLTGRVIDGSSWQPEGGPALCGFNGGSAAGEWQMDINDNAGGDSGFLNEWYVEIDCQTKGKAPTCGGDGDRKGRGLGSWANNGGGNGDDLPPPGQR